MYGGGARSRLLRARVRWQSHKRASRRDAHYSSCSCYCRPAHAILAPSRDRQEFQVPLSFGGLGASVNDVPGCPMLDIFLHIRKKISDTHFVDGFHRVAKSKTCRSVPAVSAVARVGSFDRAPTSTCQSLSELESAPPCHAISHVISCVMRERSSCTLVLLLVYILVYPIGIPRPCGVTTQGGAHTIEHTRH